MKKFISFILSLVLLFSLLAYTNIKIVEENKFNPIEMFDTDLYLTEFKQVLSAEPIYEYVPIEYHQAIENIVVQAQNDTKIIDIMEEQAFETIDDILLDTNSFNQDKLANNLLDVFDDYADEIEEATDHAISREEVMAEFEKKIKGYDLSVHYEKVVSKLNNRLSEDQLKTIALANDLLKTAKNFKTISLALLLISTLGIVVLNAGSLMITSILGAGLIFANKLAIPRVSDFALSKIKYIDKINLNVDAFKFAYIYLAIIFVIGLAAKFIRKEK